MSAIPTPCRKFFRHVSPAVTSAFSRQSSSASFPFFRKRFTIFPTPVALKSRNFLAGSPQVAQALDIDKQAQGYERLRAFESAATKADGYLAAALALPESLTAFTQLRHRVMRVYQNPLVAAIVKPFLPSFLGKRAIDVILRYVQNHLTAGPRLTIVNFNEAKESLDVALDDCDRYDTRYVRSFFRPFLIELRHLLTIDFESSPHNLPGVLTVTELGKKYPFTESHNEVRLSFAVENIGQGIALDVELSIDADDSLLLASPSQFLDHIDPGERFEPVDFRATVVKPTGQSVLVEYALRWINGDGSPRTSESIIELPAQPSDIPWHDLRHTEQYSLEPVTRAIDLIGRSEQTRLLISKIRAQNIGSFCVYGQRRVGKTSVVATLHDMPELDNITILNLETGMFIVPEHRETIDNLGRTICRELLDRNRNLDGLPVPTFSGALAPLDGFLRAAFRRDPKLRLVVVLDEFDELPAELYRRGNVSHAFFMTLRSLSARPSLGFILVGGEMMAEILSTQGQILNKFRQLRIDYMNRRSQWADFVELVRAPVDNWATITDEAVTKLYDVTAGNPFFTKFVCSELVEDMKRRRDAYVTGVEMDRAIRNAVQQAGINNFQHFWDDGVVATSDERIEEERAARRRVLRSLGDAVRSNGIGTLESIVKRASRFGLAESEVRRVLDDFEKRKVLVAVGEEYSCKVRLFERWLIDEGVAELDLTLVEEESLRGVREAEERLRVKDREINSLVDGWGSYRGRPVSDVTLKSWLNQFDTTEERRVVFELLRELRFYSGGLIRERLRDGHRVVLRDLTAGGMVLKARQRRARKMTDNVLISYYGGEGKRGQTYAKLYADENSIYHNRITAPKRLAKQMGELTDVNGIVFVDDFIGTGRTASKGLGQVLAPIANRIKEMKIDVFLVAVAGFAEASEKVERELANVVHSFRISICDPLDSSDRCFSDQSVILPDLAKRVRAKEIVESYGRRVCERHPLGFGNCQALVVFENTCPNNSLPILWADGTNGDWRPLFSRP